MSGAKTSCPSCGKEASGNFCQHCGATLGGQFCNQCGAKLEAGANFCNKCGASVGAGRSPTPAASPKKSPAGAPAGRTAPSAASRREVAAEAVAGNNAAWWVAGAAMFGLILVVGWSMVRPDGSATQPAAGAPAAGAPVDPNSPGVTDISQMSPREAAERLFDRVMRTLSQGDTAGGMGFQPMAVQAYERAEPLDLDGVYHLGLLQLLADPTAATATAERILEAEPNHVLGLGLAAEAAIAAGDAEAARPLYEKLLSVYDAEVARPLAEYQGHLTLLEQYRAQARSVVGGG